MNSSVDALQSDALRQEGADQPGDKLSPREVRESRGLLDRILNTPGLEHVVPRLQPDVLHRVIQTCGLEDCGELVALATPEQLERVFDLDLWRAAHPGLDERFDAARFGVWLEVLLEVGASVAAQKLAGMDVDLVVAGLSQHALVYDVAAVSPYMTLDGELVEPPRPADDVLSSEVGGYLLAARRADSWGAIVEVLTALDEERPDYFHEVMRGCRALSNSGREIDGLDVLLSEGEQDMFDLAVGREQRREKQGYAAPGQARAFLQMAREIRLGGEAAPPANPLARAYFRGIDGAAAEEPRPDQGATGLLAPGSEAPTEQPDRAESVEAAEAVAAVYELLLDAGVFAQPPRALLGEGDGRAPRLGHVRARLEFALDQDPSAYSARNEELAYLANTLMAGCSIQSRPFTAQEASDAVLAICNLGLENWPTHWLPEKTAALPVSFLVDHDLITVFQVGWKVLYEQVGMYAAEQLVRTLARIRCGDQETQIELDALRIEMTKHWKAGAPWLARETLDVVAILDPLAWTVLLALIDECPALHAGARASRDSRTLSVNVSDFEFISENSQIASVREFMRSLPETLRG
jgi:hypothetical protein